MGNPLAVLLPVLRGSVLKFLAPSAVASFMHGTALSLLALEPSFLARVSRGQETDRQLSEFWKQARG